MKGLQKKGIPEGIEDVAVYLGLNPSNTVFIHSTNTSPNDPVKRIVGHLNRYDHSQTLCYLPRSKRGNTSKSIILFNNKELLAYLNEVGIAPNENYLNLEKLPSSLNSYEDLSVQNKLIQGDDDTTKDILNSIKGKTIVSSYLSRNDILLSEKVNGHLIMAPELQVLFNSKINLRKFALKYKYSVPLGVEIIKAEEFSTKINELKDLLLSNNLDLSTVKLWCKLEAQSGGTGTILLEGFSESGIQAIQKSMIDFADSCKLYDENVTEKTIYNMTEFTPFVIELDVESIPNCKIVANIGVEAVISESNITILGSVLQVTNSGKYGGAKGRYLGSRMDDVLEKYESVAEQSAIPVFDYFQSEGYKGFVTLDVLVVENNKNETMGYSIDPNARFSGGTMLLSLVQYASKITGKHFYGITYFLAIKKSDNIFNSFLNLADKYLYRGDKSDFKGIIPLILNDLEGVEKQNIQIAVISDNLSEIEEMFKAFKQKMFNELNPGS